MMHVACTQGSRALDSSYREIGRRVTESKESKKVAETSSLSNRISQEGSEHSFADALNKLKVEVESLMQHRANR